MLRTDGFAFSASDTLIRPIFPMSTHKPALLMDGSGLVAVQRQVIERRKGPDMPMSFGQTLAQ